MKNPLRLFFTLYCLVPFTISFLAVIPVYFIIFNCYSKKQAPVLAHRLSRYWARFLFTAFFIRYRLKNPGYIQPNQVYVFIGNHRSLLDIPAYALSCTQTFRFLSKAELAKIPLLGYVIKNLYITVNRSDKKDRHRSLEKMLESLHQGISIFLAPEGTRNRGDQILLDFKDGAFQLAVEARLPIAALVIHNADSLLSPGRPLEIRPGTIFGEWLPPYDTSLYDNSNYNTLKEKIRDDMAAVLKRGPQAV